MAPPPSVTGLTGRISKEGFLFIQRKTYAVLYKSVFIHHMVFGIVVIGVLSLVSLMSRMEPLS